MCRNPNSLETGPWCFILNGDQLDKETCGITPCAGSIPCYYWWHKNDIMNLICCNRGFLVMVIRKLYVFVNIKQNYIWSGCIPFAWYKSLSNHITVVMWLDEIWHNQNLVRMVCIYYYKNYCNIVQYNCWLVQHNKTLNKVIVGNKKNSFFRKHIRRSMKPNKTCYRVFLRRHLCNYHTNK